MEEFQSIDSIIMESIHLEIESKEILSEFNLKLLKELLDYKLTISFTC